jgi:macrophage erythroblast attacher
MLSRMKGLKRKLLEFERETFEIERILNSRLKHLNDLPDNLDCNSLDYEEWSNKRLSHHLVDYMLRSTNPPLKKSAQTLAKEENVQDLVDEELWEEMTKVETALRDKKVEQVLSWVGENRTALKKLKVRSRSIYA